MIRGEGPRVKWLEIVAKIALLLVLPTPKNLKEAFGIVNGLIAGDENQHRMFRYDEAQWEEIRRLRDRHK